MTIDLDSRGYTLEQTLDVFEKALELDPEDEEIRHNYETCKKNLISKGFDGKIEHTLLPLPVFPTSQSDDYLLQMIGNALVIKNALPEDRLEFITTGYLKEHYGDVLVDYVSHKRNLQFDKTVIPQRVQMANALDLLENNEQTYVMWNMRYRERNELISKIGLLEKIPVDEDWIEHLLCTDELRDEILLKTHWYQMVVGSRNAGMFNHYDVFRNNGWHLHVRGKKRWHICHPDNTTNIKKFTRDGAGEVNCFSPNYESHPDFKKVIAYMGELTSGDILYYPGCFWHQTQNVDGINITVTNSSVDKSNVRDVISIMKSCCSRGIPYQFSKDLCNALEGVYTYWSEKYQISNSEHI